MNTGDNLIPCHICDGSGRVVIPEWSDTRCPCTYRRPCDILCRCSGGPL